MHRAIPIEDCPPRRERLHVGECILFAVLMVGLVTIGVTLIRCAMYLFRTLAIG